MLAVTKCALAVIFSCVTCIIPQTSMAQDNLKSPNDPTASITAKIVEAREYTASFVLIAKDSLAKQPDDLTEARKQYASAYAKYSAWVAYVKTSLQQGHARNLNRDAEYLTIAADASGSATQFTSFVDSKTKNPKAITTILASLSDLGLQLYNGIKDRRDKDRTSAANAFETDARWQPWEKVGTVDSTPPKKDDAAAPKKADSINQEKGSPTPTPTPQKKGGK